MALPSLSYVNSPDKLTPVNAPMVWSFTASFAPTSASIDTSSLVVNLEILNQNIATTTVLESVGRFYTPPRGDKYFIDLSAILKNYVTYPFMVNDLEGIITKYADQITRRRMLTREFGLGNHAVSTYFDVLQLIS